jgi:hypothetical protein
MGPNAHAVNYVLRGDKLFDMVLLVPNDMPPEGLSTLASNITALTALMTLTALTALTALTVHMSLAYNITTDNTTVLTAVNLNIVVGGKTSTGASLDISSFLLAYGMYLNLISLYN